MHISPARTAAFDILLRVERESSYASELLHSAACARLSVSDHALATELVLGVLRWRSRLDGEIATASSQPLAKLDLEILLALRLALYQFHWLDRIPHHAALNESVELVKRARKRSAAPFVNAVLRKLASAAPQPKTLPDDQTDSPAVLARFFAHPLWLVERWARKYGLPAAHRICQHNQTVPVTAIRLRLPATRRISSRRDSRFATAVFCPPRAALKRVTSRKRAPAEFARLSFRTRPPNSSLLSSGTPRPTSDHEFSIAAPLPVVRPLPSPTAIPAQRSPRLNFIPTAPASCESSRAALARAIEFM